MYCMVDNHSSAWRAHTMMRKMLFSAVSVIALLLPAWALAQDRPVLDRPAQPGTPTGQGSQVGMQAVRASNLEGMTVKNQQGETLGKIEDVVMAVQDGHIAYVVLDVGGWFDLGGKHIAAPWNAFQVNPDGKHVTLNTTTEKLRQAPSFERTYVPENVERAWLVNMYNLYGAPPHPSLQVIKGERITVAQADTLIGMDVENAQGQDLGEIDDLAINVKDGRIAYAALAYGGWLGLGENLAAVPWEALKLNMAERQFTLNLDKDKLQNAPRFAKNQWPQTLDNKWLSNMYAYYGARPYWEMR
jgi:sporulation protein YlmC with PRC-barrel domain